MADNRSDSSYHILNLIWVPVLLSFAVTQIPLTGERGHWAAYTVLAGSVAASVAHWLSLRLAKQSARSQS